jgi:superfamily II DNA helicase RecQ
MSTEYNRKYYAGNREKLLAQKKKHYNENREELLARMRSHYAENKQKFRTRGIEYYAKNKEKCLTRHKGYSLRQQGLSEEEIQKALNAWKIFDGVCQACGRSECSEGKKFRWATEHDHVYLKFRGIVGTECNLAIGHLHDDPKRARNIAEYLERTA